ncbi:MAG: potassium channel protein [Synechococcaceae cyanobacterium]|nr:potassium channel protein [Synechococcaceae cyanobacterium]
MRWSRVWRLRRRRPPTSRSRRPWLVPLLALVMVINASAVGYRITERWDWGDCYWMVAITIPTIGYGEPSPLTPAGRIVTVFSIMGGLVVLQLTINNLVGLSESGYFSRRRQRRFLDWVGSMQDHVILCGYGRIGREIASQLGLEGIPMLIVEMDPERRDAAEEKGLPVLLADATLDETLMEAGILRCRSLVAALPNDAANVYVVLSARAIAPKVRLIARSDSEEAERKLRQAGADRVISPYVAGGRTMAATALRPLSVDFMDLLAGSDCEVEEFQLSDEPDRLGHLLNRTLQDLHIRQRTGALVLAVRNPEPAIVNPYAYRGSGFSRSGPDLIANPGGEIKVVAGQLMVVMGSKEQLSRFRALLGHAVVEQSHMTG